MNNRKILRWLLESEFTIMTTSSNSLSLTAGTVVSNPCSVAALHHSQLQTLLQESLPVTFRNIFSMGDKCASFTSLEYLCTVVPAVQQDHFDLIAAQDHLQDRSSPILLLKLGQLQLDLLCNLVVEARRLLLLDQQRRFGVAHIK
jgi:hypothetical protein